MHKPQISVIAAMGRNREIGKRGAEKLLWHIPEDFKHFKQTTMGKPIIMGSATYESIGRPLPGRLNIVLAQDPAYEAPGCEVATSMEAALARATEEKVDEIFIIGGGFVYQQAIEQRLADRLYLTIIDADFPEADLFFPKYPEFTKVIDEKRAANETFSFTFVTLERNADREDD